MACALVSGTAASAHTGDTFGVTLVCTWYGENLPIPGGAVRDLTVGTPVVYTDLPTDAACVLTETRTGEAKQVTMIVDGGHSANPASVVITADRTIAVGVDNRFDKPLPATGGSSALVLGVSGSGIAGLIVGIVLSGVGAQGGPLDRMGCTGIPGATVRYAPEGRKRGSSPCQAS
ncbi:DUF5979 domain-containing protein [Microbacterium sp. MRS-1]|uniref:DUF5979 domain-containing protein n=1 Tax=Microbacterium sp. MRS-1 TaxID=1451261 RepID=UPI000450DC99|nr:DUF5979 domain-containing protein [Microbacterium sp. MRS-1]EXJ52133.1 hypothetical protein AS96_06160 [Microbacterium sp. MRS-1]